ncbi:hypothetical protein N7457_007075 [Penicillium paradoxum]|uniref:uncharacterized protein n=1 Tax=Penicillium paradoxum TaxID=176176 RepID=UPI002549B774|nr:uncharacterized protein N7457_007075 [Penicillium paradoxum]KAJ5779355.1 hypothetical protein N7457_007075 [Penicillium paradoxum]
MGRGHVHQTSFPGAPGGHWANAGPRLLTDSTRNIATKLSFITSVLSTAYEASSKIDSPPSLILVTTANAAGLQKGTKDSVTKPPVKSLQYPFLSRDIGKITYFLPENVSKTVVDLTTFLLTDERTTLDENTLLLVYNIGNSQDSIRLSASWVSVSVATTDVGELRSLADDDGVYRGGPHRPPGQGAKGPRKQFNWSGFNINHSPESTKYLVFAIGQGPTPRFSLSLALL